VSPESKAVRALAESIADGAAVDWDAAETQVSERERGVVRQLRVLAELARLHRSVPAVPEDRPARRLPVAPRTPAIGAWGHLTLLERLGGGASGEVFRAWDPQLEREVALKLLRETEAPEDAGSSRIANEGRLLARVRHPNVITVYGVAEHDGRVGLWMELVRGSTLEETLRNRGPFSAREAALIGVDLCRALAAIHAAGLIHRDVKAQNVMREDGGRIVLMDLGTGREIDTIEEPAREFAGTPLYLAPEIFTGSAAGVRTDLYSLGTLLYRLVTRQFPVDAATLEQLRAAHAAGKVTRLRDVRADLPGGFVRVVERAIATDPARRYDSAGALEADLVEAIADATRSDAAHHIAGKRSRRPQLIATAAVAAVLVIVLVVYFAPTFWRAARGAAADPIRSIAVLPLVNLSDDAAQEYFADGMTDELISTLGRLDGLQVISRTSIMQFKGTTKPLSEIVRALSVDAVLEGSVLIVRGSRGANGEANAKVRINARLIPAGTDMPLWSKRFEGPLADALQLQSDIATAIASAINLQLTRREQQALASPPDMTANGDQAAQAIELYLRGRYYWNLRTQEGLKQSVRYFQEAVDHDPSSARAYAGLADAYTLLGLYGVLDRRDAFARGEEAALKAIELDASLGEAHASLALIRSEQLEWDAASASFKQALDLKPGYATGHHWYSAYLAETGHLPEALAAIERARALDPLSHSVSAQRAALLILSRRPDEAIVEIEAVLRTNPAFSRGYAILADAYAQKREYDRALAAVRKAAELGDSNLDLQARSGYIHAMLGQRADALEIAAQLAAADARNETGAAGAAALVYAGLGDLDRAFAWLARARSIRDPWTPYLKTDWRWDRLRSDPRFERLLVSADPPR
jgi:TolB-like protein/Tfp pilus assembly protein PilF/tRNA A-37 threonylcarbamoyl transferase component Bud32